MDDAQDTTADEVRIELPATTPFLRLARLNATAFGTALEFDVDGLEDLRMAVNEAVTWLLEGVNGGGNSTVQVTLRGTRGRLQISGTLDGAPGTEAAEGVDDLISAILGATVDSFELRTGEGRSFELVKVAARSRDT
jgi:anti-sigma regulatory factor (Ser/Thr protein kinase)